MKKSRDRRYLHPLESKVYENMLSRCYNPRATGFRWYGGRGISVCERWRKSFYNFLADMGPRIHKDRSLDRINTDGDYSPSNCRWATSKQQGNNTRSNHVVSFGGKNQTIQLWADELGLKSNTLTYRLRRGWPIGQALGLEKRPPQWFKSELWGYKETILDLRQQGETITAIAKIFGKDHSVLSRFLKRIEGGQIEAR